MSEDVLLERRGGLGIVTLNRPQALNTMSLAMYRSFDPALRAWAGDPAVRAVVVQGAGPRAFCAGGDVVAIWEAREKGEDGYAADFFREEYALVRRVHRFPKPYVALIDGVTMGGGAGIAVNGRFRVATERTLFAMPEVQIGLFPDVAATRFLNLCPGRIGLYLALTGTRLAAADALYCGFATHFVPHERLAALIDALADLGDAAEIGAAIAAHAGDPGAATLPPLEAAIGRCFAGVNVEAIADALAREEGAWAKDARAAMERASPTSLKLAFRQLAFGVMEVEAALALEYRMTQHVVAAHDFFEGIRAQLIAKDRAPRWQPASLVGVSDAAIDAYFAPIGARELRFD